MVFVDEIHQLTWDAFNNVVEGQGNQEHGGNSHSSVLDVRVREVMLNSAFIVHVDPVVPEPNDSGHSEISKYANRAPHFWYAVLRMRGEPDALYRTSVR